MDLFQKMFYSLLSRFNNPLTNFLRTHVSPNNGDENFGKSYRGSGSDSRLAQGFEAATLPDLTELSRSETAIVLKKATQTFEYQYPTRFNTTSWFYVYPLIFFAAMIPFHYGDTVVKILSVLLGGSLLVTLATARNRASKVFRTAFPSLNWDKIGDLDEGKYKSPLPAAKVAINHIMLWQPIKNWLFWKPAQPVDEAVLEEALTKFIHKQFYDQIVLSTDHLKQAIQELLDQTKKNLDSKTKTDSDGNEYKVSNKILELTMSRNGIHYHLHGSNATGVVDELIRLIGDARGTDLINRASFSWLTWEVAVGPGSLVVKYNADAAFENLTGRKAEDPIVPDGETENNGSEVVLPESLYPNGPPLSILAEPNSHVRGAKNEGITIKKAMLSALNDQNFGGCDVKIVGVGPTVAVLDIVPPRGMDATKIVNKTAAIMVAGRGKLENLRIYISAKGKVIAEVTRTSREFVSFKKVVSELVNSKMALPVAVGLDSTGNPYVFDLAKAPHLLVGGTTGGGKSVAAFAILGSILLSRSPEEVEFIIVDPKSEFTTFKKLPNAKYMNDAEAFIPMLDGLMKEVNRRNARFAEFEEGDDYASFNKKHPGEFKRIVVYVDEFSELLLAADRNEDGKSKELINYLISVAQFARSAGITLIIVTQNPLAEVIPTRLRGNLPAQIALKTKDASGSKVILDNTGAEKLIGSGDAIYQDATHFDRIQTAYLDKTKEVAKIIEWVATHAGPKNTQQQSTAANQKAEAQPTPPTEPLTEKEMHRQRIINGTKDPIVRGMLVTLTEIPYGNKLPSQEEIKYVLKELTSRRRQERDPNYTLDLDWALEEVNYGLRLWEFVHNHPIVNKTTEADPETIVEPDAPTPEPQVKTEVSPTLEQLFSKAFEKKPRSREEIFNLLAADLSEYEKMLFTRCLASRKPEVIWQESNLERILKHSEFITEEWPNDPRFYELDQQASAEKIEKYAKQYVHLAFPDFVPTETLNVEESAKDTETPNNEVEVVETPQPEAKPRLTEDLEMTITKRLRNAGVSRQDVTEVLDVVENSTTNTEMLETLREYFVDDDEYEKITNILKEEL